MLVSGLDLATLFLFLGGLDNIFYDDLPASSVPFVTLRTHHTTFLSPFPCHDSHDCLYYTSSVETWKCEDSKRDACMVYCECDHVVMRDSHTNDISMLSIYTLTHHHDQRHAYLPPRYSPAVSMLVSRIEQSLGLAVKVEHLCLNATQGIWRWA